MHFFIPAMAIKPIDFKALQKQKKRKKRWRTDCKLNISWLQNKSVYFWEWHKPLWGNPLSTLITLRAGIMQKLLPVCWMCLWGGLCKQTEPMIAGHRPSTVKSAPDRLRRRYAHINLYLFLFPTTKKIQIKQNIKIQ